MQHLFPFIVVAIVIIAKLFAKAGNQGDDSTPGPAAPRSAPPDSEEERMRRFMEAVGLPPGSPRPPLVRPRTAQRAGTPPPPLLPVRPPAAVPIPPGRLRRATTVSPAPAAPVRRTAPPTPMAPQPVPANPIPAPMAPISQVSAIPGQAPDARPLPSASPAATGPAKPVAIPASELLLRLRDPAALRQAVILREVLGPPRAFQELWA